MESRLKTFDIFRAAVVKMDSGPPDLDEEATQEAYSLRSEFEDLGHIESAGGI